MLTLTGRKQLFILYTEMEHMNDELLRLRHSTAHVMAEAVLRLFPEAKLGIGPAIENGFYYDFDLPRSLNPEDLVVVEAQMKEIIEGRHPFEKQIISRDEAVALFKEQPYKLELISDLPEEEDISLFKQDGFADLCKGPHLEHTGQIKSGSFKLISIAGAYWRGDETRQMLQRIYGTVWESPKELRAYLKKLEEIEKRDHRKLGKELDLYSVHDEAGAGLIYWHPRGGRVRSIIEDFWKDEHFKNGYEILYTPHIGKSWLWQTSGHLDFYNDNMYAPMKIDDVDYYIKPMNCPFHILIYKSSLRSYRDLPFRWAELGTVYRYERSGVLHGLMRVRGFTQDDAHIICTPDQVEGEIREVLRFSLAMWKAFGFTDVKAYLATRPEKSVGEESMWVRATDSLRKAIDAEGMAFEMDEGGGAFYGPKIDLKIKDALGREWQMTTIQFDFNLTERFDMVFVDRDGREKRPFMVHRALLGSLERFFGVLIEHFGGLFPAWLAPVQAIVIPVAAGFSDYAQSVEKQLLNQGLRIEVDLSDNRLNAKIRNAQKKKIPYMIILGEKEESSSTISIRRHTGEQTNIMEIETFISEIREKIREKS